MDIVYTIKHTEVDEELIYSLRSLSNVPHDRVYFVGGLPKNINVRYVTHIEVPALKSKYDTTKNNLLEVCHHPEISEDFIWMNDDFYILKSIKDPLIEFCLNKGSMKKNVESFIERNGRLTKYMFGVQKTMEYLNGIGIKDPLSYELHIPCVFNKTKLRSMFHLYGLDNVPLLQPRSVYGNMYIKNSTYTKDVKILRSTKVNEQELCTRKFLSSSDYTLQKIKPFLENLFKEKSVYEL